MLYVRILSDVEKILPVPYGTRCFTRKVIPAVCHSSIGTVSSVGTVKISLKLVICVVATYSIIGLELTRELRSEKGRLSNTVR